MKVFREHFASASRNTSDAGPDRFQQNMRKEAEMRERDLERCALINNTDFSPEPQMYRNPMSEVTTTVVTVQFISQHSPTKILKFLLLLSMAGLCLDLVGALVWSSRNTSDAGPDPFQMDFAIGSVGEVAQNCLYALSLMYAFTNLLKEARVRKESLNKPELILTTKGGGEPQKNRYLVNEVTAAAMVEFIGLNEAFVSNSSVFDNDALNAIQIFKQFQEKRNQDIIIKEFDDQFNRKEFVYSIIINKTRKQIAVAFRGSVGSMNPFNLSEDWRRDMDFSYYVLPPPPGLDIKEVKTHNGFTTYLNEELMDKPSAGATSTTSTRLDHIVDSLQTLLKDERYSDFEVLTTGHSLGGGLAQLLSYQLAAGESLKGFQKDDIPITAVTYASPKVGNPEFCKAFEALEQKKKLRHIRISNTGDMVPSAVVPVGWFRPRINAYVQTGINFRLQPKGTLEIYNEEKSGTTRELLEALFKDIVSFTLPGQPHRLPSHAERLFTTENAETLQKMVEHFYENRSSYPTMAI